MEAIYIVANLVCLLFVVITFNSISSKIYVLSTEIRGVELAIIESTNRINEKFDQLGSEMRSLEDSFSAISSQYDLLDRDISGINTSISEISTQVSDLDRDVSAIDTSLLSDISLHLDVIESLIAK